MNLYPHSETTDFDLNIFRNPPAEYRGAPFWAWNTRLDKEQLFEQLAIFKEMGMGGMHFHARSGLDTEYLGEEFLQLVKACTEESQRLGLRAWLYDEDRWPSGFGGGVVTRDPQFRAKHLLFTCQPYSSPVAGALAGKLLDSSARASRTGTGDLLARYHVVLRDGKLAHYKRLKEKDIVPKEGRTWYAYLETAQESPWFNNQTYVDTLNKAAIDRFIEVTHEKYARVVGKYFGSVIPAIFTDEPQFVHKQSLAYAEDPSDIIIPFTYDFFETYHKAYKQSLADHLPEIFWELPDGKASLVRYRYHDHLAERFSSSYADTIGNWCDEHGLLLTGHMMEEPTLQSQTAALGEAMRSYRSFGLPGIDMLCDSHEYTTAKQAQSAAHQYGCPGVASELFGVTNWDFDFLGHKAQGDWQAALGVTVRVHHLAWVSMAGESKRDYPAAIGYQSPWYKEYKLVEDHFARVSTALTRGQALVKVGVIHPVESYWLCFGPLDQTGVEREERERAFDEITRWLLFGLVDFDFIAESLFPSQCPDASGPRLKVGESTYDVIIIPGMRTIRSTTLERLDYFCLNGGTVIFAGMIPELVDGVPSDRPKKLVLHCQQVGWSKGAILGALSPWREVAATSQNGMTASTLLHQVRIDGNKRFIFFCNTDKINPCPGTRLNLRGEWKVTLLDTLTGAYSPLSAAAKSGWTSFTWDFPAHGSLLILLKPGRSMELTAPRPIRWVETEQIGDPVPVSLSEPNALLLDMAEYRLDDEPWQPVEEILRLDNTLRKRLGYPLRMEAWAQPWTEKELSITQHTASLRFTIQTTTAIPSPDLALENAADWKIKLDGKEVFNAVMGWFVDKSIQTVGLPSLSPGEHILEMETPYGRKTNLEWCYLLGEFGVEVHGRYARITAPVRTLAFGDWTRQGLPFYAGNVTYQCILQGNNERLMVHIPRFKAPLISVSVDGRLVEPLAFAPFQVELGKLSEGPHRLELTAYGSRINAFGQVHLCNDRWTWFGPNAWRTTGDDWAYEYQLKPSGILSAPRILKSKL